jgi:hypothetical protein
MGFVDLRVLGDVLPPHRDLFDAGRLIPVGETERARVRAPRGGGRLVVRTAVSHPGAVEVRVDGRPVGRIALAPSKGWAEPWVALPAGLPAEVELTLTPTEGEWLDCHVWILERASDAAALR